MWIFHDFWMNLNFWVFTVLFVLIVLSILSIGSDEIIDYASDPLLQEIQQGKQFDHNNPITFKV